MQFNLLAILAVASTLSIANANPLFARQCLGCRGACNDNFEGCMNGGFSFITVSFNNEP